MWSQLLETAPVWLPGTLAMLTIIIASGTFSASETAIFYLSREELQTFQAGNRRQRLVVQLLQNPDRVLTTILFWNLVMNLTYFSVSVIVAQRLLERQLSTAAGLFGLFGLVAIILFGEVIPKSGAVVFRRQLAPMLVVPIAVAARLLDPAIPTFQLLTQAAQRVIWPGLVPEPYIDTDDLERAIEISSSNQELVRQERQVLHNVLDLSEMRAEEVMRPRGTYLVFRPPVRLQDLRGKLPPSDYVLISGDEGDHPQFSVTITSLRLVSEPEHLERRAQPVTIVPWCATAAFALEQLRLMPSSVAAVVNEFGETIGIITYEDIVDTVLHAEPSRARRILRRDPILEIAPGRLHVEGMTTLRHLARRLQIDEFDVEAGSQVTVGGLLQDRLEHMPEVGDECDWEGFRIRVIDTVGRGHLRAVVWMPNADTTTDNGEPAT